MKYVQPIGGAVDDPYVDANPAGGIEGSAVPAAAIEDPQREIVAVISGAGILPDAADKTQLRQAIAKMVAGAMPPGAIIYVAKNSAPTGFMKANGAAVSRLTYGDLFAAIGTTFGAGDGLTTFNLPDLRAEFLRGWDDGRGIDSGRGLGSTQVDEYKSHSHTHNSAGNKAGLSSSSYGNNVTVASNTNAGTPAAGPVSDVSGGAETRPRNIALLACVKF